MARCKKVPEPEEAYCICSGRDFTGVTKSLIVFTGSDGCAVISADCGAIRPMGVKSFSVSYGSFLRMCGLEMWLAECHHQRVTAGRRACDDIRADRADGARPVIDYELLASGFGNLLLHDAAHHIHQSASGPRTYYAYWLDGIVLGDRGQRACEHECA
jgi:hypothetical protein